MSFSATQIATAYHEAGHAVVALALGRDVQRVSIKPNQLRLGRCELKKGRVRAIKDAFEADIMILFGGLAAETRHFGQFDQAGAAQDLRYVRALVQMRGESKRQVERIERRMLDKTEYILDQPGVWTAVQQIAEKLLQGTIISGREARHLFEQTMAQVESHR